MIPFRGTVEFLGPPTFISGEISLVPVFKGWFHRIDGEIFNIGDRGTLCVHGAPPSAHQIEIIDVLDDRIVFHAPS